MTVALEEFTEWRDSVEIRLGRLESVSDQHTEKFNQTEDLLGSIDEDLSKLQVEFRAQRRMLQALHDTQSDHTARLRSWKPGSRSWKPASRSWTGGSSGSRTACRRSKRASGRSSACLSATSTATANCPFTENYSDAKASSRMSRPSSRRSSPMTSGGRKRSTLPNVPQVSTTRPGSGRFATAAVARVRVQGARLGQLDGDHRAAAADIGDHRVGLGQLAQPGQHDLADAAGPARQVLVSIVSIAPSAAAQATGLPP